MEEREKKETDGTEDEKRNQIKRDNQNRKGVSKREGKEGNDEKGGEDMNELANDRWKMDRDA